MWQRLPGGRLKVGITRWKRRNDPFLLPDGTNYSGSTFSQSRGSAGGLDCHGNLPRTGPHQTAHGKRLPHTGTSERDEAGSLLPNNGCENSVERHNTKGPPPPIHPTPPTQCH